MSRHVVNGYGADEMDLLYVVVYDVAMDERYLKVITGDVPNGVTPLTADEAKASGLEIR